MIRYRDFGCVTAADFIVRSAYQMGKTPLLPIMAVSLGASDLLLGFIVSVSTLTGMVLKPLIGMLSDWWGRRVWLFVGTAFFAGIPFVYNWVTTPEQLFAVRILHGTATAIYGPVTLAYVLELSIANRAERIGWFSLARNAGYVVGPAVAGWMLLTMTPVAVFTVIGFVSATAFLPVVLLPEVRRNGGGQGTSIRQRWVHALRSGCRVTAVWIAGGMEAGFYVTLYAAKTFLPIYALSIGINTAAIGGAFAVQEGVHIALTPLGGRISDRLGHLQSAAYGMIVLGIALPLFTTVDNGGALVATAVLIGLAQSLVLPSAVAFASSRIREENLALGIGLVGMMRNIGKVVGPAMAGAAIALLDFTATFRALGMLVLAVATALWFKERASQTIQQSDFIPTNIQTGSATESKQ